MQASRYVPEIDGLRAIAVMSVLFYHVGFRAFPGGFVGVDVFFVISGPAVAAAELAYNDRLAAMVPEFVSPNEMQCPDGACRFFDGARVLYRDDHHLNIAGSEAFVADLRDRLPF